MMSSSKQAKTFYNQNYKIATLALITPKKHQKIFYNEQCNITLKRIKKHEQINPIKLKYKIKAIGANEDKVINEEEYRKREPKDIRILVVGATGYIGKFVVKELTSRGFNVIAMSRERSGIGGKFGKKDVIEQFPNVEVCFGDVTNIESLKSIAFKKRIDVVISCLASRSGGKKDSWLVDYEATLNSLKAAEENNVKHFILISAICVQKPLLEFQRAKLKFESELINKSKITYSIVRPTAFFKSLASQVDSIKNGIPSVVFGDGTLTSCKPISERDLASYIADCVLDINKINKILPIGGPGPALNSLEQAKLIFKHINKEAKFINVPIALMDNIINILSFFEKIFPNLEDTVEKARIGKYYATESMLVWDDVKGRYDENLTPSYGNDTLDAFYKRVIEEGLAGQELGDQAIF